jgi:kexin
MRLSLWLAGLALAAGAVDAKNLLKPRNFETHDYYTLHLRSDESPEKVARALGLQYEGPLGELADHYYYSAKRGTHNAGQTLDALRRRRRKREIIGDGLDGILWSRKQRLKQRMQKRIPPPVDRQSAPTTIGGDKQDEAAVVQRQQVAMDLDINDPEFNSQWHLFNTVELGHDLNISAVWTQGITGHNATVAIVDDGLDMYSDDLRDNYFAKGSYDFNDHTAEPRPRLSDDHHGTRCAGEVAAGKNNACGVGVAYDSKVAGIRILSGPISDEDEALAINYGLQDNDIYSCSWGPPDDGKSMDAPDLIIKKAMQNAIQNGRGGLGSIFVFASGNGASREDNCNFDGYTNSIYSITVGAIDRKGNHPYYSEKCSASLVVTYSSGSGDAIHTTDIGPDSCTSSHGGTSAAAPIGAGLFALALGIRPDLTWRDMQYLCVNTAVPINLDDEDGWQETYIGNKYSHTFAYGKLDAYAFIEAARDWEVVKPQAWFQSPWQQINHPIPQGDQGLASSFQVTEQLLKGANVERLEQVQVTMNVEHQRRGDLSVELISPEGLTSHLSATRRFDEAAQGYLNWTFMSVVHW